MQLSITPEGLVFNNIKVIKPIIFFASNKVSHFEHFYFAVLLFLFNHIQSTLKL
jgi:hypothetical protein